MALPTISSVVAQMSTLVDAWHGYTSQLRAWLAGTASGGPGSDGSYPLTDDQGNTFLVPSPAAQAARVDAVVDSAQSYATAADSSAVAAATSAMNASSSETAAAAHRDDAQTSASTAEMYATAAGNSAADARSSKTASAASESASSASAAAAAQSATDAQTSATDAAASASTATARAASAASSANDAYASALAAQTAVTGLLRYVGSYDASTGVFPANPSKGDFWKIGTAGTVGGVDLAVGDQIIWSGSGWDKIDNTESVTSVAGRVGAVTLSIPDIAELQGALDNRALIGGTPRFSDVVIGADSDILLYEGVANQLNLRVGPSTAYKYFSFSANGDFVAPNGDVIGVDLRTDRGGGTGAVWFGGAGDGYLWRSGVDSFQLRAGTSFFDLTAPGTILTTGNFNPASFATSAQGAKADAALPAANLLGFTKFAVVTSMPGSPDPNTIYFVK